MELDITEMMADCDYMPMLSGSCLELGDNAGAITWNNSKAYAEKHPLLHTPEAISEARDYFLALGAWSLDEIAAMPDSDIQALMVQDVAAAIRELEHYDCFDAYEIASQKGQTHGQIFRVLEGDTHKYYFQM